MSHYKRDAGSNRDALFGLSPGTARKTTPANKASTRIASTTPISASLGVVGTARSNITGRERTSKSSLFSTSLTGEAKVQKMREAEEYREKAKKAMQRTLFASPDPISASSFYHRAAEAYKLCGENRLERLHRVASGDCQMGHGAHASAAAEYIRAAELSEASDETVERKRNECRKLYEDAAKAWAEEGDNGKKAECMLKCAFSLLIGTEDDVIGGRSLTEMNKTALKIIEEAVESFVPDPLNRYSYLRRTGTSAFIEEGTVQVSKELLDLCHHHLVTATYAHEKLYEAVYKLARWGEYASALYACGAVTQLLEHDGFSTISLARSYCAETILALALGDVVAADKTFLEVHLQNSTYLTARECKLAEDLIRAVKSSDIEALESARNVSGDNRSPLSNLDTSLRTVVSGLKISGVAKVSSNIDGGRFADNETPQTTNVGEKSEILEDEMNNLMNEMGLDSDDDDDDDGIDLR